MAKIRLAASLAWSASVVTEPGSPTATRGAARPASSAALVMVGTMCDAMVCGPVIQVTVPSASWPASLSMVGPRAATRTGGASTLTSNGAIVVALMVSPLYEIDSPRSSGISADRYSRMCRAGRSKEYPNIPSITSWCDSPMPSTSRPPVAAWVVSVWAASMIGWRGYVGTTAVPSSMSGTSRPTTARSVRASYPNICDDQAVATPCPASIETWATTPSIDCETSMITPWRMAQP